MKDLKLNDELSTNLKISNNNGYETEGKLYISKGKIPYIELTGPMSSEKNLGKLNCTDGLQHYTLYNIETYGSLLYPALIILGDYPTTSTSEITVSLSGISDWLQIKDGFQIQNGEINKKINFEDITITITETLKAELNYHCTITKNDKSQTVIDEKILITLSSPLEISLSQITKKCHTLCNLFSLLLGHPIDIECIWIRIENNQFPVYFVGHTATETTERTNREYLYPFPGFITERNVWPTIFQTAFMPGLEQHERFTNLWSRIPSLVRYTTLWEYEILGYVSILDKFTESLAKKKSEKLPPKIFSDIKKSLKETLSQKAHEFNIESNPVSKNIEKYIESLKNTETPTFHERFKAFIESVDPRIIEIIEFSQDDFKLLKRLRDQVAHSNPVITLNKSDITHEITIKNKLALMIHYCINIDFGLTTNDFIKSLGMTTHPIVRGAKINRDKIYKFNPLTPKITLSSADYQHLTASRYSFHVFSSANHAYTLQREASEKTKEFGLSGSWTHICDFLSCALEVERSKIQYHSTIHITSNNSERTVHNCCIISDEPQHHPLQPLN